MPKPANYNKLVLAHGVTMALALLWFIPIAIFAAAFLRSRPQRPLPESEKPGTIDHHSQQYRNQNEQGHGSQAWKYIHIAFNVTATALIIAGFTLGYYASGNSFQVGVKNAHFVSTHATPIILFFPSTNNARSLASHSSSESWSKRFSEAPWSW